MCLCFIFLTAYNLLKAKDYFLDFFIFPSKILCLDTLHIFNCFEKTQPLENLHLAQFMYSLKEVNFQSPLVDFYCVGEVWELGGFEHLKIFIGRFFFP